MRSKDTKKPVRRRGSSVPTEPAHSGLAGEPKPRPKRRRSKVEGKTPHHRNGKRARGGAAARRDDGGGLGPSDAPASPLLDERGAVGNPVVLPQRNGALEWGYRSPSGEPAAGSSEGRREQAARRSFDRYNQQLLGSQLYPVNRINNMAKGGAPKRSPKPKHRYGGSVVQGGASGYQREAHRDIGGGVPNIGSSYIPSAPAPTGRNTIPEAPAPASSGNPMGTGLDALELGLMMKKKGQGIGGFNGSGLTPAQQTAVTSAAEDAIAGGVGAGGAGSVYNRGGRTGGKRGGRSDGGRNSKRGARAKHDDPDAR
jgi:hypothetical protein